MGRAVFHFDEAGNTLYVIIAFYACFLFPYTYVFFRFWDIKEAENNEKKECECRVCTLLREGKETVDRCENSKGNEFLTKKTRMLAQIIALIGAWVIFFWLALRVLSIGAIDQAFDPYAILGLDQGAGATELKKRYRALVKKHHPDLGGDPEIFIEISKAYQALTDDKARENWKKYGNPDGPTSVTFGFAIPKWIVAKENEFWMLAIYGLIFFILLPVGLIIWWRDSKKKADEERTKRRRFMENFFREFE